MLFFRVLYLHRFQQRSQSSNVNLNVLDGMFCCAIVDDFYTFLLSLYHLRLFHQFIDDFKSQNHHFSQKIENFSKKVPIF